MANTDLFTTAEDDAIIAGRARGTTCRVIGVRIGRTPSAVYGRAKVLADRALDAEWAARLAARSKKRACKGCSLPFVSPHAGVRFCDPCRDDMSDVSVLAPNGCGNASGIAVTNYERSMHTEGSEVVDRHLRDIHHRSNRR